MLYFKDENNEMYAYEEGQAVKQGLIQISESEKESLLAEQQANFHTNYLLSLDTEDKIRDFRNRLLSFEVDPMVSNPLRWNSLTDAQRTAWTQYRTDLLNVPQQAGFPHNITWPNKPS
jgi:hypothetical protein